MICGNHRSFFTPCNNNNCGSLICTGCITSMRKKIVENNPQRRYHDNPVCPYCKSQYEELIQTTTFDRFPDVLTLDAYCNTVDGHDLNGWKIKIKNVIAIKGTVQRKPA